MLINLVLAISLRLLMETSAYATNPGETVLLDEIHFYSPETTLFPELATRFGQTGRLTAEELYLILDWKAARRADEAPQAADQWPDLFAGCGRPWPAPARRAGRRGPAEAAPGRTVELRVANRHRDPGRALPRAVHGLRHPRVRRAR